MDAEPPGPGGEVIPFGATGRKSPADGSRRGSQITDSTTSEVTELLPSPNAPLKVARQFLDEHYTDGDGFLLLRSWRGGMWKWRTTRWVELEERALKASVYRFTENASYKDKDGEIQRWHPTRRKVGDLLEAVHAAAHLRDDLGQPGWIDDTGQPPAREIVSLANGLLHVPTRTLHPHNPHLWNQTSVPFAYEPDAPEPARWLGFLNELWPDDPEAIAALQEFFGYVISGRTDQHKILLIVGPPRGGKGTIARILMALIGDGNHAGPTLAGLATNFGLSPLIGKPLAIVADARLQGGNKHQVVERLLSISGEDVLTIDRKYRDPWTGTLPTRFVVISNELPEFGDASGAIARRFVILTLVNSWLGKEDTRLTDQLHHELPGILTWALEGLARLEQQGRFTEPPSSHDALVALQDTVSPVSAFIRDCCERDGEVPVDLLWSQWQTWAEANGHRKGNKQQLGKNLKAVVPGLRVRQPRNGTARERIYEGLQLRGTDNASASVPPRATPPERSGTQSGSMSPPPDDHADVPDHVLDTAPGPDLIPDHVLEAQAREWQAGDRGWAA